MPSVSAIHPRGARAAEGSVRCLGALPTAAAPRAAPVAFMAELVQVLPQVRSRARQLSTSTADAQDLVQETCRRALEAHQQFAPGSNLRAWLLRILFNHHHDRSRRRWLEIALGDAIEQLPAEPTDERTPPAWRAVSDEDTALAVAALPPEFRITYILFAVRGFSYAEIAAQLHIPYATVGTRLRRARARLKGILLERTASHHHEMGGTVQHS